jgi:hypothetical protein
MARVEESLLPGRNSNAFAAVARLLILGRRPARKLGVDAPLFHQSSPQAAEFLVRNSSCCFQPIELFDLVSSAKAHDLP